MKTERKILALLYAIVMCMGFLAVPAMAVDTEAKTLSPSFIMATNNASSSNAEAFPMVTTAATKNTSVRAQNGNPRKGFVTFDLSTLQVEEGTWQDYVAASPGIEFTFTQNQNVETNITISGITANKEKLSAAGQTVERTDLYTTTGVIIEENKIATQNVKQVVNATDYVKNQSDGIVIFEIKNTENTKAYFELDMTLEFAAASGSGEEPGQPTEQPTEQPTAEPTAEPSEPTGRLGANFEGRVEFKSTSAALVDDELRVHTSASKDYSGLVAFKLDGLGDDWQNYINGLMKIELVGTLKTGGGTYGDVALYGVNSGDKSVYYTAKGDWGTEKAAMEANMALCTDGNESGLWNWPGTSAGSEVSYDVTSYVKSCSDGQPVFYIAYADSAKNVRISNNTMYLVFTEATDETRVAEAKDALTLNRRYANNFTLPTAGLNSTGITWASKNTDIISISGANAAVTVPVEDTVVTLTATITLNDATDTKDIDVIVSGSEAQKLVSVADTYIRAQSATMETPFNKDKYLRLNGSSVENFIRFEEGGIAADDVTDATLYLYYQSKENAAASYLELFGLTDDDKTSWDETLTAKLATDKGLYDSTHDDKGAGDRICKRLYEDTEGTGHWLAIDITDYVKSQTDGIYAFRFYGGSSETHYATREVAGFEPYIEIATGDTGAAREAVKLAAIPKAIYKSVELPVTVTGADGNVNVTYTTTSDKLSITGGTITVDEIAEDTEAEVKVSATVNGKTAERTYKTTLVTDMFTFSSSGAEVDSLTAGVDVSAGVRTGLRLAEGTKVYIAEYSGTGALISIDVITWAGQSKVAVSENTAKISVFVWDSQLRPIACDSRTK